MKHTGSFHKDDLVRVRQVREPREPVNVGDVVIFNSGSPLMIVEDIDDKGMLTARWVNDGMWEEMRAPEVCFHKPQIACECCDSSVHVDLSRVDAFGAVEVSDVGLIG